MRQDPATRAQPPREGEGGIALVSVMFFTMLMAMLGATLLTSSRTETQISANQLYQTQAFYIAEAGLAQAKAWLDANQTDAELMSALLVESQELNPDQSSLTRPDLTVVATPLGTQPFGNGTVDCAWDDPGCRYYDVVIRDNNDDADLLTDSDSQWVITSRGSGPTNASQFIEIEVLGTPAVTPSGAMSARGNNLNVDFDQSGGGVGSSISPNSFNGNPHDLNGAPLLPGGSCAAVPPLSTDGAQATQSLLDELDDLRSNIVRRANSECDQNGETKCLVPGDTGCCTPGLWWIRGSAVTPILDWMDPASYSLLDLSAPQLHAIDANYVPPSTQPPTMILPDPPTAPLDGAEGNTDDPLVEQVPLADMQDDLNAIQDLIDAYPVAVDITGGTSPLEARSRTDRRPTRSWSQRMPTCGSETARHSQVSGFWSLTSCWTLEIPRSTGRALSSCRGTIRGSSPGPALASSMALSSSTQRLECPLSTWTRTRTT